MELDLFQDIPIANKRSLAKGMYDNCNKICNFNDVSLIEYKNNYWVINKLLWTYRIYNNEEEAMNLILDYRSDGKQRGLWELNKSESNEG